MPDVADYQWSADEVRALPEDGNKHECIDGVHLVTPSPTPDHQRFVMTLFRRLDTLAAAIAPAEVFNVAQDLELEADSMVQPDLFVARPKEGVRLVHSREQWGTVHLAVEVLSPRTARYDRGLKRSFYLRAGVEEYWIVDLAARLVERWIPGESRPEVIHDQLVWQPRFASESLVIDLPALFAVALDD